jgi:lysophospholipase L1-like esterase
MISMHIDPIRDVVLLTMTLSLFARISVAAAPTTLPRAPQDAVTPAEKNPQRHEQFLKRAAEGNIDLLLLGDSIMDAWPSRGLDSWQKLQPYHPADFGISGDRTEHLLWRITHGELDDIHPKVVMILIGTNNVGHFTDEQPEWAAAGVEKIVQTVREKLPEAKILLLGVFPRDTKDSVNRKKVAQINQIISKLDDGKNVFYLDIGDKFLDANGEIPLDIMPDKLHPTAKGYDIWFDAIHEKLDTLMKQ